MDNIKKIQQALDLLEKTHCERSALVVMPPDSKSFLMGNQGGLINLATASLRAALGEKQTFKKNPWLVIEDYDWDLAGIDLDDDAHIYLPPRRTKWQTFRSNFWGATIGLLLAISLLVGIGTILTWLIKLILY
jgi:hypothetical protein